MTKPTNLQEKQSKSWEKKAIGKNVHSVYTRCNNCKTWGINIPLNMVCGNCGKNTDTLTYYDAETIEKLITAAEERGKQELSLCPKCNCMTHKVCGKCAGDKINKERSKVLKEIEGYAKDHCFSIAEETILGMLIKTLKSDK